MSRYAYIVGGAASGKSTFMSELLGLMNVELRPLTDIWSAPKVNGAVVKLRGHYWSHTDGTTLDGVYLGVQRPLHPGADGLDKACQPAALSWARTAEHPPMVVGEGAVLANTAFLGSLNNLLLVHLTASSEEISRRCRQRGSNQAESFIAGTATRARNLAAWKGSPVLEVDTESQSDWSMSLDLVADWLSLG